MLTAVNGYYNGDRIVMDEPVRLSVGQKVIITILETGSVEKKKYDLKNYMGRGEKLFASDAGEAIKELRSSDRI